MTYSIESTYVYSFTISFSFILSILFAKVVNISHFVFDNPNMEIDLWYPKRLPLNLLTYFSDHIA